jgi:hypothetical protein
LLESMMPNAVMPMVLRMLVMLVKKWIIVLVVCLS